MKKIIKLNIISAVFAFVLLIQFQPIINLYRFSRITNLAIEKLNSFIFIFNISTFITSTIMFYFIIKKYFSRESLRYIPTILWIPYYISFTKIVNWLFPITDRGDKPALVIGILIIIVFIIYPIYIAGIILLASEMSKDS